MFGVHRIALCRCVASPMLYNNGLLVRPPPKMGNALGNMKTPSEIFFSNKILRTYKNFSDPPLFCLHFIYYGNTIFCCLFLGPFFLAWLLWPLFTYTRVNSINRRGHDLLSIDGLPTLCEGYAQRRLLFGWRTDTHTTRPGVKNFKQKKNWEKC